MPGHLGRRDDHRHGVTVRFVRWITVALLAVNLVMIGANQWVLHRNREMLARLRIIDALQTDWVRSLPPHPCGPVILPGERCVVPNETTY